MSLHLLAYLAALATAGPPVAAGEPFQSNPEDVLWSEIRSLGRGKLTTSPSAGGYEAALKERRLLLKRLQRYGALYPGGGRRSEVLRLELSTLYEIGSLTGGSFDALRRRVMECLEHPPIAEAEHEAAYWAILLNRSRPSTVRTERDPNRPDEELLKSYASYVERYPRSRHSVALLESLFEHALTGGNLVRMGEIVTNLRRDFPAHPVTGRLAGRLEREQAVGRPFWLTFVGADEKVVDTRRRIGSPLVIVVWDSVEPGCGERIGEVEAFRRRHRELLVFGVNLDARREEMSRAADDLELRWPQFNDGRGRANQFARTWGVSRTPVVFVIDRSGRLLGSTSGDAWKALAEKALEN